MSNCSYYTISFCYHFNNRTLRYSLTYNYNTTCILVRKKNIIILCLSNKYFIILSEFKMLYSIT